jgi:hypothetical protein
MARSLIFDFLADNAKGRSLFDQVKRNVQRELDRLSCSADIIAVHLGNPISSDKFEWIDVHVNFKSDEDAMKAKLGLDLTFLRDLLLLIGCSLNLKSFRWNL